MVSQVIDFTSDFMVSELCKLGQAEFQLLPLYN